MSKIKDYPYRVQILVAILVIIGITAVFRGTYGLLETYLFPSSYLLSLWASVLGGIVLLALTHFVVKELM